MGWGGREGRLIGPFFPSPQLTGCRWSSTVTPVPSTVLTMERGPAETPHLWTIWLEHKAKHLIPRSHPELGVAMYTCTSAFGGSQV